MTKENGKIGKYTPIFPPALPIKCLRKCQNLVAKFFSEALINNPPPFEEQNAFVRISWIFQAKVLKNVVEEADLSEALFQSIANWEIGDFF